MFNTRFHAGFRSLNVPAAPRGVTVTLISATAQRHPQTGRAASWRGRAAKLVASAFVVVLPLLASSCSGDGTKVPFFDDNQGPQGNFPPKLSAIYANVLAPTCAPGCHEPGGTSPFIMSTLADSYANLVSKPNEQCTIDYSCYGLLRVEPGAPNRSYIIVKLKGLSEIGDRMPLPPRRALDPDTIATIAEWISRGALND